MTLKGFAVLFLVALLVFWLGAMALLHHVTRSYVPRPADGEEFVQIDGGSIRYQMAGNGERVVLFLHGFNGDLSLWDKEWEHLAQCPVRRLRIDVPGFGASQFETEDYGLAAQAGRLDALLEALDIDKVTVVGGSMGGSLAVALAAEHPERVEQLALLAPSGYPGALQREGLFGLVTRPGPIRKAANWLARTPVYKALFPDSIALQATTVTASYGPAWLEQLKKARAPAFIAWSKGDRIAEADTARNVANALPDGTLFWLDESSGHRLPVSRADFVAEVACLMGQGVNAHDVAGDLPAELLREGEGSDASAGSRPVE